MRQLLLAVGTVCAITGFAARADAQNSTAQGNTMPGQVVGSGYSLPQVGKAIPKQTPNTGMPIGSAFNQPITQPYDPNNPLGAFKNSNINTSSVAAPVANTVGQANDSNMMRRMYDRLKAVAGIAPPDAGPSPFAARTGYTPGITRRNRERAEERMWRRD